LDTHFDNAAGLSSLLKGRGSGVFLKSHGYIGAQKEFELKDGPKGPPPTAVAEGDP